MDVEDDFGPNTKTRQLQDLMRASQTPAPKPALIERHSSRTERKAGLTVSIKVHKFPAPQRYQGPDFLLFHSRDFSDEFRRFAFLSDSEKNRKQGAAIFTGERVKIFNQRIINSNLCGKDLLNAPVASFC